MGRGSARLAGILLGLALALALAPPAAGQFRQLGPGGRISLASQTPWVEPDGAFELRLDLSGVRRPEALTLEISVHEAVTSRSQFFQTLDGRLLGDDLWRQGPRPLADIELDDAGAVPVVIPVTSSPPSTPSDNPSLVLAQAGVHPVRVVLRDTETATEVDALTTHLVRARQDDAAPLAVAWVQPVGAPPALQPDGTTVLDDTARDTLATVAAALGATDVPLTLVPRPETLDALALAAPGLLEQLGMSSARRQVLAAPYVSIDPSSLLAADLPEVVDAQRDRGAAVVERLLGRVDRGTQVSQEPADAVALAGAAVTDRLVLPEAALAPLKRPLTLANPFLVAGGDGRLVEAAVVDSQLQSHFGGDDRVLSAHHLLADLAVLAYDSPGLERGVVVQPPLGWIPAADLLTTALPALGSGSIVRPVTLDQLFDEVLPAPGPNGDDALVRTLAPQQAAPAFDGAELRRVRADVASYATMVDPSDPGVDLARRLLLVSSAASLPGERRGEYLAGAAETVTSRLGAIRILSEGSLRLTSREATIPLTLENDVGVEVEVTLALESDKLDFVDADQATTGQATIPLTLGPGSTPVMVPVVARTSGDFPLLVNVRSPDGRLEVASARLTVRSTFLSGVGLLVSAGAGLFLCGWWARHWRSARRDRRLVSPTPPA